MYVTQMGLTFLLQVKPFGKILIGRTFEAPVKQLNKHKTVSGRKWSSSFFKSISRRFTEKK